MSRTRTLQMLLVVSATAWVMVLSAIGGTIALHLFDRPHEYTMPTARVHYERVYRQQPVLVHTPYGRRCCCPPPPCCPRSAVTYVPYQAPPAPRAPWLFLFTGLLAASAIGAGLISRRGLVPMQP